MKPNTTLLRRLLGATVLAFATAGFVRAADATAALSAADEAFLQHYGEIQSALVHDDLGAARKAAAAIQTPPHADEAAAIAHAADLKAARNAFKTLSRDAVAVAKGHTGYHVAFCPMVPDDAGYWVQTSTKIANPYMGKRMPGCGSIVD